MMAGETCICGYAMWDPHAEQFILFDPVLDQASEPEVFLGVVRVDIVHAGRCDTRLFCSTDCAINWMKG